MLSLDGPCVPIAFWPREFSLSDLRECLDQFRTLDGLAACLIEVRMSYLAQNKERFVSTLHAAARIFGHLAQVELFRPKRMRSALLVMEAHCIPFMARTTVGMVIEGGSEESWHLTPYRWPEGFKMKCNLHVRKLSPSSKETFVAWSKQVLGGRSSAIFPNSQPT